jgi:hypothetical protein
MRLAPALLLGALAWQGLTGLAGGVALVADPSGRALGLPAGWLEGTPFADYLVPGLVLASLFEVLTRRDRHLESSSVVKTSRLFPGDAPKAPGAGYEPVAGPWYDPVTIPKPAGGW